MSRFGLVIVLSFVASVAHAQQSDASRRAAEEQQRAAELQRQQTTQTMIVRPALDPARIQTVALWPGPGVPCKLPKRDKPYTCHRLMEGPVLFLTPIGAEILVGRGDAAVAKGERSWWAYERGGPFVFALAAGEVVYAVGDWDVGAAGDAIVTIYR